MYNMTERRQNDGLQDEYSNATVIDCSEDPRIVRQEFARDADLNNLIPKFGGGNLIPARPPIFGEIDFTRDLQDSLLAVRDLNASYNRLPTELRARYNSWEALLTALQHKELTINLGEPPAEQPANPPAVPPA